MSWILFGLSALVAVATFNALWPVCRPWWLRLPSFNAGWFANELPIHLLFGHATVVVVLAAMGAVDDRPGRVGVAVSVAAVAGLAVLAAAQQRAGNAMEEALGRSIGPRGPTTSDADGMTGRPVPWSWLVWPWLAWSRSPGVEPVARVIYSTVDGRSLELDIHRPGGRRHDCPVLVEIHGGGWITGDRRLEARPLMAHMAAQGWVCVTADYRVGRTATWPDQIIDVNAALAWVREHVAEYGGDPDFVAISAARPADTWPPSRLSPPTTSTTGHHRGRLRRSGRACRSTAPTTSTTDSACTRRGRCASSSASWSRFPSLRTRRGTSAARPWPGSTQTRPRSWSFKARATTWCRWTSPVHSSTSFARTPRRLSVTPKSPAANTPSMPSLLCGPATSSAVWRASSTTSTPNTASQHHPRPLSGCSWRPGRPPLTCSRIPQVLARRRPTRARHMQCQRPSPTSPGPTDEVDRAAAADASASSSARAVRPERHIPQVHSWHCTWTPGGTRSRPTWSSARRSAASWRRCCARACRPTIWPRGRRVEPLPARAAARTLIDQLSADPLRMTIPRLTGMLGGLRQVIPKARRLVRPSLSAL